MAKCEYITPQQVRQFAKQVWDDEVENKQLICRDVLGITIQRMHQCFKHDDEKPHKGLEPCINLLRHYGVDISPMLYAQINHK